MSWALYILVCWSHPIVSSETVVLLVAPPAFLPGSHLNKPSSHLLLHFCPSSLNQLADFRDLEEHFWAVNTQVTVLTVNWRRWDTEEAGEGDRQAGDTQVKRRWQTGRQVTHRCQTGDRHEGWWHASDRRAGDRWAGDRQVGDRWQAGDRWKILQLVAKLPRSCTTDKLTGEHIAGWRLQCEWDQAWQIW